MRTSGFFRLPSSLLLLLSTSYGQQLPYNPTRIFRSPQNEHVAYIVQPNSATGAQFSLSALDISTTIHPSSLSLSSISSNLPFLSDSSNTPWNAIIDSAGNITVYTGSCGNVSEIWKLNTQGKETGLGEWSQQTIAQSDVSGSGPQYLSSAIAFSSNVSVTTASTDYYYFGGMCPDATSTASTWVANANYSNSMFSLAPSIESDQLSYIGVLATTRNVPIAQAGQSLTALQPTYSNHSDGSQTQQQDFVLLGGHTQAAFINMSQVALWSLPQAAWTYFPVASGDAGTRTDLAVRDTEVQIEPRSGHTAVLSSDGTKIVVFGGWVGDINTPAEPQLAVLNIADDYGGSGDWSWSAPDVTGANGLPSGAGIYGHGAIMLPGNIMFVTGGYSIAAPSAKVRRAGQTLSSTAYLFNISSGAWLPSYSMSAVSSQEQASRTSGPLSDSSQKAALGIGIGLGAVAIAALVTAYTWYRRRNKKLNEEQEKGNEELTFTSHRYDANGWGMPPSMSQISQEPVTGIASDREQAVQQVYQTWRSTATTAERTGLLVEVPSPTRGLRRNIPGRAPYPYERRRSQNMEVIEERQDQENSRPSSRLEEDELQARTAALLRDSTQNDPFTDNANPLRSHPIPAEDGSEAGQTVEERKQEVQEWVQSWGRAAEALMSTPDATLAPGTGGRSSPSKSDRTTSMLSDSSAHSSWSNRSGGAGPSGIVRTLSTRSAAILNSFANTLVGGTVPSPTGSDARASLPSQRRRRGNSFGIIGGPPSPTRSRPDSEPSDQRQDADAYSTAQTSFAQLQAEGESLLGGTRSRGISEPSSPVKDKRNSGWYGSVKRAISGARTTSMAASSARYEDRSGSSSPQKLDSSYSDGQPPRRAASDASFLRSRRGARDWNVEDEEEEPELQRPSAPDGEPEGDWDVERAAENRVVQLMFTVPRQRLRVVNVDDNADQGSLLSQDER